MNIDTVRRVYAYIYRYQPTSNVHLPSPREAYDDLKVTKRQYIDALRWLERHGLLARSNANHAWRFARLTARRCLCGTEITPDNAEFGMARGQVFLRRTCSTCEQVQDTRRERVRRKSAAYARVLGAAVQP